MASIKYVGPFEGVAIGDVVIARGETVDLDGPLVKELLKRDDFERPAAKKSPAKKKAVAKTSEASASDDDATADAVADPPQEG